MFKDPKAIRKALYVAQNIASKIDPAFGRVPLPDIVGKAEGGEVRNKKNISKELEKEIVQTYNEHLPSIKEQYNTWAADKSEANYDKHDLSSLEDIYGDLEDVDPEAVEIAKKHGHVIQVTQKGVPNFYSPDEAPSHDQHMEDVVREEDGVLPATSLHTINYKYPGAVYEAFSKLANHLGWQISGRDSKYFDVKKEIPEGQRPLDEYGDPITHHVVGVRIADHPNTSKVGHAVYGKHKVHLNLAPQDDPFNDAHSLEDAAHLLSNVKTDNEGEIHFNNRKARVYSKGGFIHDPEKAKRRALMIARGMHNLNEFISERAAPAR